jgi:hypothetical protein
MVPGVRARWRASTSSTSTCRNDTLPNPLGQRAGQLARSARGAGVSDARTRPRREPTRNWIHGERAPRRHRRALWAPALSGPARVKVAQRLHRYLPAPSARKAPAAARSGRKHRTIRRRPARASLAAPGSRWPALRATGGGTGVAPTAGTTGTGVEPTAGTAGTGVTPPVGPGTGGAPSSGTGGEAVTGTGGAPATGSAGTGATPATGNAGTGATPTTGNAGTGATPPTSRPGQQARAAPRWRRRRRPGLHDRPALHEP